MTTNDDQRVPSEDEMRHAYWLTRMLDHHAAVDAAFDRFIARVRRDAQADAWDEGFEVGESNGYAIGRDIDTDENTENPYREQED